MKRLFLLIGLVLLPLPAYAVPVPSPWFSQVMERIQNGLSYATTAPAPSSCDPQSQADAIRMAVDRLRKQVDTQQRITRTSRDLKDMSVCQRNDLVQLEEQMEKIRIEMLSAAGLCNRRRIMNLGDAYDFAVTAYDALRTGGTDPAYHTDILTMHYHFQDGGPTSSLDDTSIPICPFNSDYLPTSFAKMPGEERVHSYGCDIGTVTDGRSGKAPTMKESFHLGSIGETQAQADFLTSFESLAGNTDSFIRQTLTTLAAVFDGLTHGTGGDPSLIIDATSRPIPTEHAQIVGCVKLPDLPDAFSEKQTYDYLFDFIDRTPADTDVVMPIGLLFRPSYTPFSLFPDSMALIRVMVEKMMDAYRLSAMLSPEFDNLSIADQLSLTQDWPAAAADQARIFALIDAENRDTLERLKTSFAPIGRAMKSLDTATSKTLPQFVRDLAFLMERTCVDTYCTQNLQAVMKRILNPYCTPYANDKYKDPDSYKKCYCLDPASNGYSWSDYDKYCKADFTPGELKVIEDSQK